MHAGEVAGAESVRAALDALPVTRIGHGVRAAEDPALVRRLAAEGRDARGLPGLEPRARALPRPGRRTRSRALREAGVTVTVSTDDPPYFHTDLVREYAALAAAFGWGAADFLALNLTAADAAFCDPATRAALLARLTEAPCPTT